MNRHPDNGDTQRLQPGSFMSAAINLRDLIHLLGFGEIGVPCWPGPTEPLAKDNNADKSMAFGAAVYRITLRLPDDELIMVEASASALRSLAESLPELPKHVPAPKVMDRVRANMPAAGRCLASPGSFHLAARWPGEGGPACLRKDTYALKCALECFLHVGAILEQQGATTFKFKAMAEALIARGIEVNNGALGRHFDLVETFFNQQLFKRTKRQGSRFLDVAWTALQETRGYVERASAAS